MQENDGVRQRKTTQDYEMCAAVRGGEGESVDGLSSPINFPISPSTWLLMRIGRMIGLARPINACIVGLANGNVPLCEIGDDTTNPAADDVIGTGIGPHDKEPERGIYIGERDVWFSRRKETKGETAQRFDEVGYRSKRSSSTSVVRANQ